MAVGGTQLNYTVNNKKQQRQELTSNKPNSPLSKINCSFPSSLNLLNLGECSWAQLLEGWLVLVNMGLKFNPSFFLEHHEIVDWLDNKNETEFILFFKLSISVFKLPTNPGLTYQPGPEVWFLKTAFKLRKRKKKRVALWNVNFCAEDGRETHQRAMALQEWSSTSIQPVTFYFA